MVLVVGSCATLDPHSNSVSNIARNRNRKFNLNMFLSQEKLNAIGKTHSSIFEWRGQFTPEFVDYLLDTYGFDRMTVADPFCGSGTVLLESILRGYNAYGYDINPAAYLMSKFITYVGWSKHSVESLVIPQSRAFFDDLVFGKGVLAEADENTPENRMKIVEALKSSPYIEGPRYYVPFIMAVLFKLEKTRKKAPIKVLIYDIIYELSHFITHIGDCSADVFQRDARFIGQDLKDSVDLIITSPPYINVFNYHQNYRELMEGIGYDILNIAEGEFGSNRKNRSNRFKTVVQYTIDMGKTIESMLESLKLGGRAIIIIGVESTVNGIPFNNAQIIQECIDCNYAAKVEEVAVREFKNRFGETILEKIIVVRKVHEVTENLPGIYRTIAVDELKRALEYAKALDNSKVKSIEDAIEAAPEIVTSKLIQ